MKSTKFLNLDCIALENESLSMLVTQSVGPRILSFGFKDGGNLFAELPEMVSELPDGREFQFYGGHRLWEAPETMPNTYVPDNFPVEIATLKDGLSATQRVVSQTGIEKSIEIHLKPGKAQVVVDHLLTNRGSEIVECAPWAVTQLKPGGVALLPQSYEQSGLLPNRSIALWPYSDAANPLVSWGNREILVRAEMKTGSFKIGFPNPRGWLAYWLAGTLFVKRAAYNHQAQYFDLGSSSECYFNDRFLELETLGPISKLQPGERATHTETWELFQDIEEPTDHAAAQRVIENLGLN
ncbi:MAG: hypothetical protein ABFS17_03160 [Chloroflexota bacterium]